MKPGDVFKKIGEGVKKGVGIEGSAKDALLPMIGYNSANITLAGGSYVINLYYLTFLTEVEKLSSGQAGLVMLVATIWDMIANPIMGLITDRTRSKYGRHRRYFLWGLVPIAVTYFIMWTSFGISGTGNTNYTTLYYIIAYMLFKSAYTLISVPHTAMLPEIAPRYFERTQYSSMGYLLNTVGQISSFMMVSFTLGFFNMSNPDASQRPTYMMLGGVICLWLSWPLFLTFFGTKEPSSLNMQPPQLNAQYTLGEYVQVFRNRAFRQYFFLHLCWRIATSFYSNTDQYFILYVAKRWNLFNVLNTMAGVGEASGFPLNFWLVKRFGKQFCGKVLTPVMIAGLLMHLLISPDTMSSGIVTFLLFASVMVYNFGLSGPGFVAENIQPDVTDVDEMITGRRREGAIAVFSNFIKRSISGLLAAVVGFTLENVFGFQTGVANEELPQTAMALVGLRITFIILPVFFMVLCFIGILRYKMNKGDYEMIKAAIKEKHETGEVSLSVEEKRRCEEIAGQKFHDMWIGQPLNAADRQFSAVES